MLGTVCSLRLTRLMLTRTEPSEKKTTLDSIPRGGTGPVTNSVADPDMGLKKNWNQIRTKYQDSNSL